LTSDPASWLIQNPVDLGLKPSRVEEKREKEKARYDLIKNPVATH